jgi:transposase InsO family protein
MDDKIKEAVALLKHQIISPVLMDSGTAQAAHFEQMSKREFDVPGRGPRRYKASTMRIWLYAYRSRGFQGLMPKTRNDRGAFRALSIDLKNEIRKLREDLPELSCVKFYDRLLTSGSLGVPPIGMETVRRFLKSEGLYKKRVATPRKRFEMRYFGELWTTDFMHGPHLIDGKRRRRAILMAIIDDHSRMIVGHAWSWAENTKLLEIVFKEAILNHGCPDRIYCDNGAAFSSHYLTLVSANLGIGVVHSKPYDSPSRGKIERFFRTVRQNFLPDIKDGDAAWTLPKLNEAYGAWIREYHQRPHSGIQMRPIDRYQISVRSYPRKRVDEELLEEHFLVSAHRSVGKDSTVSLNTVDFEVPASFIGQRVELKYSQERPGDIFLYDKGVRVTKITPVNSQLNGQIYKPGPRISDVALHGQDARAKFKNLGDQS